MKWSLIFLVLFASLAFGQGSEQDEELGDVPTLDLSDELKKLGHNQVNLGALMDEKVIPLFTKYLKESKISELSRDLTRSMVLETFKDRPIGKVFVKCPKCLEIFVDIIRDREAMPSLLQIFGRQKDLRNYGFFWFGGIVFLFFFKRMIFPKKWPFYKRWPVSLLINILFTILSFGIFYYLFREELGPTLRVVLGHF